MAQIKIFSNTWFDMVEQANSKIDLNLSPAASNICLNIIINEEQTESAEISKEENKPVELYLYNGCIHQGQHLDAKSTITLSYETLKSLLQTLEMNDAMKAFIDGKILVTGDMSQLMALKMVATTDEQKLLFNTILDNTAI